MELGKCVYCGAKTTSVYNICPECEARILKQYESEVRGYFVCCPLCGSEDIEVHLVSGGRDTLTCEDCGAKWHLYIGLRGFRWAELEIESQDKKGLELLGKRLPKDEWRKMAHGIRKTLPPRTVTPKKKIKKEKDVEGKTVIIKEREIIKLRCPYCRGLYDESYDKCPHCGAKR